MLWLWVSTRSPGVRGIQMRWFDSYRRDLVRFFGVCFNGEDWEILGSRLALACVVQYANPDPEKWYTYWFPNTDVRKDLLFGE